MPGRLPRSSFRPIQLPLPLSARPALSAAASPPILRAQQLLAVSARILIIDPDPEALEAYRQALAPKASTWTIDTAQSSEDAFAIAQARAPDIAVASLALNDGQGLKILSQIVDVAPLAHAFIAAPESAKPQLARAFEGGCRYLPEPCPPDRLLLEFQRCLAVDSWMQSPVVKELFATRSDLESLPQIYLRVVDVLNDHHASTADVAAVIANDLALSGKILEAANSAFYSIDQKISDIAHAVTTLGFDAVKHVALAVQLFDRAKHPPQRQALVNEIWHHSASVAHASRRISLFETEDSQAAEEAYSAGLLHDVGKLVLLQAAPDAYLEAQRIGRERSIPPWQAELETIGCDHAEVGAYLLARWGLPESLCEAAALHHRPANSCRDTFSALAAVHAANAIIRHRKDSSHLDSNPSRDFFAEIGAPDRWEEWSAVAVGDPPPSKKPKLKSARPPVPATPEELPPPTPPQHVSTESAHAALALAVQRAAEAREERLLHEASRSGGRATLYAFIAGICVCLVCLHIFSTDDDSDISVPAPKAPEQEVKMASSGTLLSSRQTILQATLEANNSPKAIAAAEAPPKPAPAPEPPPPPPPFPTIRLGAIFLRASGPKAQINGRIVGEGEYVSGVRIVRIERISVVLEHYGRQKTLTLD